MSLRLITELTESMEKDRAPALALDLDEDRLRAEALRVYQRYVTEVVEAFNLCPWAKRARLDGRVRPVVLFTQRPVTSDASDPVQSAIDTLGADAAVDIGLLIFPLLDHLDPAEFRRFVTHVRERDGARYGRGQAPFLMADFHPRARCDATTPSRLVSFIRRSPDPTIQLVRKSAIESVRPQSGEGTMFMDASMAMLPEPPFEVKIPLHQRIAEANHATISRAGFDQVGAILDSIRQDRDASYARLGQDARSAVQDSQASERLS